MLDMLSVLEFLKAREIIHGDIKEDNILVDPFGKATLVDFGISHSYANDGEPPLYPICTITHRPPEVILRGPLDSSVDTWSLGMTIFSAYFGNFYIYAGSDLNEEGILAASLNFQIDVNYLHEMERMIGSPPANFLEKDRAPLNFIKYQLAAIAARIEFIP